MPSQPSASVNPFSNLPVSSSERLLWQMLEALPTAAYIKDRQHRWIYANPACEALIGGEFVARLPLPEAQILPVAIAAQLFAPDEAAFVKAEAGTSTVEISPLTLVCGAQSGDAVRRSGLLIEGGTALVGYLTPVPSPSPSPEPAPLWNMPQFLALLSNVPAMIYQLQRQVDGSLQFRFVSPGAFEVFGLSPDTIQSTTQVILDRIHPLDRASFDHALDASAQALHPIQWEGRYYKPTGELRWLQMAARPQASPEGQVIWDGLLMDITSRKQAEVAALERAVMEQALADNETRFRTIAATIPGALFQLRIQGDRCRMDYVSDRVYDITGLPADLLLEDLQHFIHRVHPADQDPLKRSLDTALEQLQPWYFEGRIVTLQNEVRWWRVDAVPVQEPAGDVVLCGVMLDITARKGIEEAYRESEQRLRMALEVSGMSVWSWEVATNYVTWTTGTEALFGQAFGQICTRFEDYLDRVHPDDREKLQSRLQDALENGTEYRVEHRIQLEDGSIRWLGGRGGLWRDSDGSLIGIAGTLVDITDRKAAGAALKASEARYRTLIDNLPGSVYRCQTDPQWTLLFQSEAIAGITGYPIDHSVHQHLLSAVAPEDYTRVETALQTAIVQRQPFDLEYRILHAGGAVRWVQNKGQPIVDAVAATPAIDGVLIDITRRKESEARYRDLAQREALINRISTQIRESLDLRDILQTAVQAIRTQIATDRVVVYQFDEGWQGKVVVEDVSPPWGSTLGEMGTDNCFPSGYADYYSSGRVRAIDDIYNSGLDECHLRYLEQLQVKANLIVPILLNKRLWGLLIAHECRGPRRWTGTEIELLLSLAGQVGVAIGQADLYRQATENADRAQQEAENLEKTLLELQRTQSQLVQTEKMSSLGQLVAGVAHEINNPVSFIDGNLSHAWDYAQDLLHLIELYQTHYPEPIAAIAREIDKIDLGFLSADFPKLLESMRVGAERIKNIVMSLRTFSRMDEAEIKPVDIHDGLDSTVMILQHRLKANGDRAEILLQRDYGDLPPVECYAGQLNQVFMNLLSNAIDALEDQLETGTQTQDPVITIRTRLTETEDVEIAIADNGPGIPEAVRNRIFEPFFTTKPVGKGTGIGLSISYQIVTEKHQGTLICEADPSQGTTFTITIPQHQGTT